MTHTNLNIVKNNLVVVVEYENNNFYLEKFYLILMYLILIIFM